MDRCGAGRFVTLHADAATESFIDQGKARHWLADCAADCVAGLLQICLAATDANLCVGLGQMFVLSTAQVHQPPLSLPGNIHGPGAIRPLPPGKQLLALTLARALTLTRQLLGGPLRQAQTLLQSSMASQAQALLQSSTASQASTTASQARTTTAPASDHSWRPI